MWRARHVISSQIDEFKEESWPCCAVRADRGEVSVCDDEAWSVRYWPVDVVSWLVGDITLTGLRYTSILKPRYSLSAGSFLPSFPLLLSPPPPLPHAVSHFLASPSLIPSSLPSLPLLSAPPSPSSVLLPHSLPLPSIHPHGSNSLSGLSHSLQASRQSLQRLEEKTNSFKQHYIGLAWSMSHTDRWKRWPLSHCLFMGMMKHGHRAVLLC